MAHTHEHEPALDNRAFAEEEDLQERRLLASGWEGGRDRRAHSFAYERDAGPPSDVFYSADARDRDGHRHRDDPCEQRRPCAGAEFEGDDEADFSASPAHPPQD